MTELSTSREIIELHQKSEVFPLRPYGLPDIPLRPVVSAIRSSTIDIAKQLSELFLSRVALSNTYKRNISAKN